ncbi:spore coat protein [Oceanobacillus kimchii]|uniref:spore coat protein n=1 Tax=Oceanobacillus kimchii TaxID=746691 RepID=UPI003C729148
MQPMNQGQGNLGNHQPNQMKQPSNQAGMTKPGQSLNHGGHELFDAHEVIAGIISMLDQYQMYEQHIQDPALKDILQRQTTFVTKTYNTIVESFQTGHDPKVPTQEYKMQQSNNIVYGIQAGKPKKPNASTSELSDQGISAYMLGNAKSLTSLLAMTAVEMTNPVLRRVIADTVPNFIELSYEIFLYQNKHAYYQVPQLAEEDMINMLNSYTTVQQPPNNPLH